MQWSGLYKCWCVVVLVACGCMTKLFFGAHLVRLTISLSLVCVGVVWVSMRRADTTIALAL